MGVFSSTSVDRKPKERGPVRNTGSRTIGSPTSCGRRWEWVLIRRQALAGYGGGLPRQVEQGIPGLGYPFHGSVGVTPASLRGGGASHLYETTEDSELVRHRGRWASSKMCEIYIQEVGGHQFFANLGPHIRTLVAHRAAQVGEATRRSLLLLQEEVPPAYHYTYFSDMARGRER